MKKIAFLLAVILVFIVCGCENVSYPSQSEESDNTSVDFYESLQSALPEISSDTPEQAREFLIITDDKTAFYQSEAGEEAFAPEAVSRVLEERNAFIREKYGVEIRVEEKTLSEISEGISEALQNNEYYCDMLAISAEDTVSLYKSGLLADMNKLPDFDIENGFFNEETAKSLATNNSLYMLADPCTLIYDETYVMFCNKDILVVPEGEEDPETLALQGKWTWDKLDEYARASAPYAYSHSTTDYSKDTYGFGAYYKNTVFPVAIWTSADVSMVGNTYKTPVEIDYDEDYVIKTAEKLKGIYGSRGAFYPQGEEASAAFCEGRLAFFCNKLSYIYALRDGTAKGENIAVLPMPKLTEEQSRYYCMADNGARVISVPKTVESADEATRQYVSVIISATCAVGGKTVTDAYRDTLLANYLNSNTELLMLSLICDSAAFDFCSVFGLNIDELGYPTSKAIADYFDDGLNLYTVLHRGLKTFREYCEENFG